MGDEDPHACGSRHALGRRSAAIGGTVSVPIGRILGVDLGERRIGLAVADADGFAARPLATVNRAVSLRPEDDAGTLARFVAEQGIAELVVGLPLEASGAHG